jgi:hypothetical protein
MPKTSVHKEPGMPAGENQVRRAGQVFAMQPIA